MTERPPVLIMLLMAPPALLYHLLAAFDRQASLNFVRRLLYWAASLNMRLRALWHVGRGPLNQYDTFHLLRKLCSGFPGRYQIVELDRKYCEIRRDLYDCVFLAALKRYGAEELAAAFCQADADFWASRGVEQQKWNETDSFGLTRCRSVWSFQPLVKESRDV